MGYGESQVMRLVGHVKSDTLAIYTHMLEEILQDAATAAFARLFPGRRAGRTEADA
jgi:site-specific recombinase XerD